jgi:hypothetical protein
VNNLLLLHKVSPSETTLAALPDWYGAEAPASSGALASCYCYDTVGILAIVAAELELRMVLRQILSADIVIGAESLRA